MSPRSRARRGFSLLEALVSIVILVVVMTAAMTLLFSMKGFAQKQQSFTAPRQTSRAGLDYLSYFLEGAGDMNTTIGVNNPNALLMYMRKDADKNHPVPDTQVSYNNLTAGQAAAGFGDEGTDILTVQVPVNPLKIKINKWPGDKHAADMWVDYTVKCNDNDANMLSFKEATGATGSGNQQESGLLTVFTDNGDWAYFKITGYQQCDCSDTNGNIIHVIANPGQSDMIDPPSGHNPWGPIPAYISGGITFASFRVKDGRLQQKNGMFDPAAPNDGYFDIVENVEDFQVAYVYGQGPLAGQVWNTAFQTLPVGMGVSAPNTGHVPTQCGPSSTAVPDPSGSDVTNVIGLRVSVTARSLPLPLSGKKLAALRATSTDPTVNFYYRPQSEDHPKGALDVSAGANPLVYHHSRYTTTLMIRNRALGS